MVNKHQISKFNPIHIVLKKIKEHKIDGAKIYLHISWNDTNEIPITVLENNLKVNYQEK